MVRLLVLALLAFLTLGSRAGAACTQFSGVKAWTGTIAVTYDRTAQTPNYREHSSGGSSVADQYAPSLMSAIAFNGYDETWTGRRSGSGHLADEVTNADGSALSRPVRLDGSGPVLAEPPLGRFGPEQFWISSSKCQYAFYTSAAVNAVHSRDGATIDGTDVHVEGIPLPRAAPLSGSRTFHLPNASNYNGGDQFHFPCLLVDWCNRDAGAGTATVTWTFTPSGGAAPPTQTPIASRPKCPRADAPGPTPAGRIGRDFANALAAVGQSAPLGDILTAQPSGTWRITIRLAADGRILPSQQCIDEGIADGSVPSGSQTGAAKLLVATVQQANGQTRVTARIDDVATGVIEATGLGNSSGTGDAAIQEAATSALQQLGGKL